MKRHPFISAFLLLMTAAIWGAAFVAQSVGMEYVGPFTFNAIRTMIGAMVLFPVVLIRLGWSHLSYTSGNFLSVLYNQSDGNSSLFKKLISSKHLWMGGIACGTVLFIASSLQQFGIQYTSVGKAGFITAFYIVIVPLLGLFRGKKPGIMLWAGVVLALIGFYLLCITGHSAINIGDVLIFLCAIMFALHILVIDHFAPMTDAVAMSCIQFFVCGLLSTIMMLIFESPSATAIRSAMPSLLYAGIMSCGVAYTLQIIGQKGLDPTIASLLLSLESVFAVWSEMLLLHKHLTTQEMVGCTCIFAAILLAQCPSVGSSSRNKSS